MDKPRFILTTIGKGIVAMLESDPREKTKRGEYLVSSQCVAKNVSSGQFVDVSEQVTGATGKVYALASDLT